MHAGNAFDANAHREPHTDAIDCDAVWDLLILYVDGEATEHERVMVEQHLAQCADCRSDFEFLRLSSEALHTVPSVEPPAALTESILSATVNRPALSVRMCDAVRQALTPAPARYGALVAAGAVAAFAIVSLRDGTRVSVPIASAPGAGAAASSATRPTLAPPLPTVEPVSPAVSARLPESRPAVAPANRSISTGVAVAARVRPAKVASRVPVRVAVSAPHVAIAARKPSVSPAVSEPGDAVHVPVATKAPEAPSAPETSAPVVASVRTPAVAVATHGAVTEVKPAAPAAHIVLTASSAMNPEQIASLASFRRDQRLRPADAVAREVSSGVRDRQIRLDVIHSSF